MKQRLEDYIYEQIKANLSEDLQGIIIKGHSTGKKESPYICVDISEIKPFDGFQWGDYIYEVKMNISIAASAYEYDYNAQFQRTRAVQSAVEGVQLESDIFLINLLDLESITDARDDNNLGEVLEYTLIFQPLEYEEAETDETVEG